MIDKDNFIRLVMQTRVGTPPVTRVVSLVIKSNFPFCGIAEEDTFKMEISVSFAKENVWSALKIKIKSLLHKQRHACFNSSLGIFPGLYRTMKGTGWTHAVSP